MSDEEKKLQGSKPSGEVQSDLNHEEVVDDARALALSEALQSSFKIVLVFMVILAIAIERIVLRPLVNQDLIILL